MSDSSDFEMQSALPKKITKKPPKSPTAELFKKTNTKKITTKEMIHQALVDLKSRKGTSVYAIKKYIQENYKVDVEKINHLIKKYIKSSVELGTIVQTKGIGVSGSFKLATGKDKLEKKKPKKETKVSDKTEKSKEKPQAKAKPAKKETEKKVEKKPKKVEIAVSAKNKDEKVKSGPSKVSKKKGKGKSVKSVKTPSKKRAAMMKRKSIGSIIKPPKMKPTKANV